MADPVYTYRYADRSGRVVHRLLAGAIVATHAITDGIVAAPYQHDPLTGLEEARAIVQGLVPPYVRTSMLSYSIRIGLDNDLEAQAEHDPKMQELDLWEEAMIEAGKTNTPWPPAPAWLAAYSLDF